MKTWNVSPTLSVVLALVAWIIAVVSFSGVVLAEDLTGRLIFGFVWTLIGIMWWGQYFQAKKSAASDSPAGS